MAQPQTLDYAAAGASAFGERLREARKRRRLSQLQLALTAEISSRHLSFLEVGRAMPSARMVGRLARALELSPLEQDRLLLSAGFAPQGAATAILAGRRDCAEDGSSPSFCEGVFETALQLQTLDRVEEIVATAGEALARLGLRYFFTGLLTPGERAGRYELTFDAAGAPPLAWLAHCRERNYRNRDPLVRETAISHAPFFWDDVRNRRPALSPFEARILDEGAEFGVRNGFVMPIRRADGGVRAVSAMAERLDARDPALRLAARILCTGLLEALDRLNAPALRRGEFPALSPAAADCLRWIAAGRTLEWIAERRASSAPSVERSLAEACLRLGATDLTQAVIRAKAYGLLSFS